MAVPKTIMLAAALAAYGIGKGREYDVVTIFSIEVSRLWENSPSR